MTLPVLVAPDAFKGTLTATEVASAVARGLRAGKREAIELPVADGGEGTMEVIVRALGAELRPATVSDPLGRTIEASFAMLPGGRTAVVEAAQASGLGLVREDERDPLAASSRGTGELIGAACAAGASAVLVTVGGTATTDGGVGALEALAESGADPRLEVLCDARIAWEDAPRVFGPQKGADPQTVGLLERRLDELAEAAPRDPRGVALTGAAGGLSGGLWAHRGAKLMAGAPYVLDLLGFDALMRQAAFVVTGEGRIDSQTLQGKIVGEVATRSRQAGVACHAVVGQRDLSAFDARILDLSTITEAGTPEELETAGHSLAHSTSL